MGGYAGGELGFVHPGVSGCQKACINGEHKMWGLTS